MAKETSVEIYVREFLATRCGITDESDTTPDYLVARRRSIRISVRVGIE